MNPYQELAQALRDAGVDEGTVYGALMGKAQERGDDPAIVFAFLYGSGEVLSPSEPL